MKAIEVVRSTPPEIGRCRAEACQRLIEWTRTVASGRRMPIDHPLREVESFERNGTTITRVDPAECHFASCVAAPQFRRRARRGLP